MNCNTIYKSDIENWKIKSEEKNKYTYTHIFRGTRDQIANIRWVIKKAREFHKNIYYCFMTMQKPLTVWITINCEKFWRRWEYQTTWPASWETCMQLRKQQLELDMEQQTGSK